MVTLKTCYECKVAKDRSEFYNQPRMTDGLCGMCKACKKVYAAKWRASRTPDDRAREYTAQMATPEQRQRKYAVIKAWRHRNKPKARCHGIVNIAVREGRLVRQPCCVCGSGNSVAHHESYDHPLVVIWYCHLHHAARHKTMATEGLVP